MEEEGDSSSSMSNSAIGIFAEGYVAFLDPDASPRSDDHHDNRHSSSSSSSTHLLPLPECGHGGKGTELARSVSPLRSLPPLALGLGAGAVAGVKAVGGAKTARFLSVSPTLTGRVGSQSAARRTSPSTTVGARTSGGSNNSNNASRNRSSNNNHYNHGRGAEPPSRLLPLPPLDGVVGMR